MGLFTKKWKLCQPYFIPNLYVFLLLSMKEDILKNDGNWKDLSHN